MAKTKQIVPEASVQDDLASVLADSLNKKFKASNYKVAYILNEDADSPCAVTEWLSTGNDMVDLAISNRPNGGLPVGRVIEIQGESATGKSLFAAHALVTTQKKDGLAVYIDTENAVSQEFLEAIGLDLSKLLYVPLETIEDCFETIETIVEGVRKSDKKRLVTIVLDSIMGASTKVEMSGDYDKDGWATTKAIVLSKAMRKITNLIGRERICLIMTNQLRERLGVMFGDKVGTSGGKAVGFHSSVRLRLQSVGQIKVKTDGPEEVVGVKTKCKILKNRLGPPARNIEYDIYFDSGIDNYGSWLSIMKDYNVVSQAGAWYTYTDTSTGEIFKFQSKEFAGLIESNPELKQSIYESICDKYIFKYKSSDFGIDDIAIDTNFESEES